MTTKTEMIKTLVTEGQKEGKIEDDILLKDWLDGCENTNRAETVEYEFSDAGITYTVRGCIDGEDSWDTVGIEYLEYLVGL